MPERSRPAAHPFRILPLGDAALTVELGCAIDPALNARVIAFAETLEAQGWEEVLDIVPTYCSVTLHIDPRRMDLDTIMDRIRSLSVPAPSEPPPSSNDVTIPVLYGGAGGPDIEDLAAFANTSVDEVIRQHSSVCYRVYMLGFTPGFPYLGSVPESLAMPRLATPRSSVPAGSVGIAERQTGIYPTASPGGWRLIGRTPVALYRPTNEKPFLLKPGDQVRFIPIDADRFNRIRRDQPL